VGRYGGGRYANPTVDLRGIMPGRLRAGPRPEICRNGVIQVFR
jgi:hypothetical protein